MEYRHFGRTGAEVSPLCLGCMMFGGKTSEEDAADIIDHALDQGVNFFDTANVYGRGKSEIAVGKALQRNGKRDDVFLATKVHGRMGDGPNMSGNHRRNIIEQCEASLKRLQTDHIDLYQIHRPDPHIPIDETLRALDDLIRAGKVRYIGTSTYAAWQLMESLWVAKELGLNRMVCEQPPYHLLDRTIEKELIPMAQTYGIALIPWSPLAGGFLTGKYKRGQEPPEGARFVKHHRRDLVMIDRSYDIVEEMVKIADEKACTVSQLALAWLMNQPGVTSPIIGPRTMEQFVDNLGAIDVEITDDDRARLDAVAPPKEATALFYDADFGPHPHRW